MFRKILTTLFFLFPLMLITQNAQAKFMNKFKDGFYFEKYKTEKEVKNALLELHPIGSYSKDLITTLQGAGAIDSKKSIRYRIAELFSNIKGSYDINIDYKNYYNGSIRIDKHEMRKRFMNSMSCCRLFLCALIYP